MAADAILDFKKLLPFLYYLTDRHQNVWKHWDFDVEHTADIRTAKFRKFNMAIPAILDFENCCHIITFWPIIITFCRNIATLIKNTSVTLKNLSNHNSRWRPSPSWILKSCCYFFSIWLIVTKISGNIGTSIWNISMKSEMRSFKIQDGGRHHLEFRKTVAISLLFGQSSPKLVGRLQL